MSKTIDIFGKEYVIPPKGLFAGMPGKGPEGKKCKHCAHIRKIHLSKTYNKCGLMQLFWTRGKATDIQSTAPACEYFEDAVKLSK